MQRGFKLKFACLSLTRFLHTQKENKTLINMTKTTTKFNPNISHIPINKPKKLPNIILQKNTFTNTTKKQKQNKKIPIQNMPRIPSNSQGLNHRPICLITIITLHHLAAHLKRRAQADPTGCLWRRGSSLARIRGAGPDRVPQSRSSWPCERNFKVPFLGVKW